MADYNKLTVVKLKEILKERGLPLVGLKATLVSRLVEDDEKEELPSQAVNVGEVTKNDVVVNAMAQSHEEETSPGIPVVASEATIDSNVSPDGPADIQFSTAAPATDTLESDAIPSEELDMVDKMETTPVDESTTALNPIPEVSQDTTQQETENMAIPSSDVSAPQTQVEPATQSSHQQPQSLQTATQSSVDRMELVEDSRKRKRRSETPPPSSLDVAAKKAKALDGSPRVIMREESEIQDLASQQTAGQNLADGEAGYRDIGHDEAPTQEGEQQEDTSQTPINQEKMMESTNETPVNTEPGTQNDEHLPREDINEQETVGDKQSTVEDTEDQKESRGDASLLKSSTTEPQQLSSKPSPTGAKFKSLFAPAPSTPTKYTANHDTADERDIAPAQHPATTALYIRNFKRPLSPESLKRQLKSLAKAPNDPEGSDMLVEFFLDNIKSHCLVKFTSIAAASRVRLALHDRVWPDERDRKALWVDYIPEERIGKWIEVEQEASGKRGGGQKRWEVVYEKEGDGVAAYLQEEDPSRPRGPLLAPRTDATRNGNSALTVAQAKPIAVAPTPKPEMGKGFKALDDLFHSTTAKPKLYFQPMPEAIVSKRLDKLAEGHGHGRGMR